MITKRVGRPITIDPTLPWHENIRKSWNIGSHIDTEALYEIIRGLPHRRKEVTWRRFGVNGVDSPVSMSQIARERGVTKQSVQYLLKETEKQIQTIIRGDSNATTKC